jgi:hypothetical protein
MPSSRTLLRNLLILLVIAAVLYYVFPDVIHTVFRVVRRLFAAFVI